VIASGLGELLHQRKVVLSNGHVRQFKNAIALIVAVQGIPHAPDGTLPPEHICFFNLDQFLPSSIANKSFAVNFVKLVEHVAKTQPLLVRLPYTLFVVLTAADAVFILPGMRFF
jgi:hypothetical protein